MTVGGAETTLYPIALDCRFYFFDATFESFFLFDGGGGVGGAGAATAAVVSSTRGKGRFNFRKEFCDFAVLGICGPNKMVERPLENIITMCRCGLQVVEVGVKIVGQFCTLGENAGLSVEWGRVVFVDNVVDQLGGGCLSEQILSPSKACITLKVLVEGVEGVLPGPPHIGGLWLPFPLRTVVGEGVRKEEG